MRESRKIAGEGEIGVGAGEVGGEALSLGAHTSAIDIVPVVFGGAVLGELLTAT